MIVGMDHIETLNLMESRASRLKHHMQLKEMKTPDTKDSEIATDVGELEDVIRYYFQLFGGEITIRWS